MESSGSAFVCDNDEIKHGLDVGHNTKVWPIDDETQFQLTSQSNAQYTIDEKVRTENLEQALKIECFLLPFLKLSPYSVSSMANTDSLAYRFECDYNKYLICRDQAKFSLLLRCRNRIALD